MPPKYNPRAERDELVQLLHIQPPEVTFRLYVDDPLITATLDYLDPEITGFFIGSQIVRAALLDSVKRHILSQNAPPDPHVSKPVSSAVSEARLSDACDRILAATPAGTELHRQPDGHLVLVECHGASRTHYDPASEPAAWRAFTNQAIFETTGCPF